MLWLATLLPIAVLMFSRGVVHIVVAGYIDDNYYFRFDREVVHIVDCNCLMFYRGVVHIVVAVILLIITV